MPALTLRALVPDDVAALVALRREALTTAPLAFCASVEDDRGLSVEGVRASLAGPGYAVFGAFEGDALVGMAGVIRQERLKLRHRAAVWGLYVTPRARGRGLGAALLAAAVERARAWPGVAQVQLSVTEAAPEARRLYERAGFRVWGTEPDALEWEGRRYAEHHLLLDLAVR